MIVWLFNDNFKLCKKRVSNSKIIGNELEVMDVDSVVAYLVIIAFAMSDEKIMKVCHDSWPSDEDLTRPYQLKKYPQLILSEYRTYFSRKLLYNNNNNNNNNKL
jgi:hypothetical protein